MTTTAYNISIIFLLVATAEADWSSSSSRSRGDLLLQDGLDLLLNGTRRHHRKLPSTRSVVLHGTETGTKEVVASVPEILSSFSTVK